MAKKWTRRKFVKANVAGSVLIAAGQAVDAASFVPLARLLQQPVAFSSDERETLRAAMDEIIPAADGMPAASAVGSLDYIERLVGQVPEVKADLRKALQLIGKMSGERFHAQFARLTSSQRVETLTDLEKQSGSDTFAALRDAVYEAYYTQPSVWKLIGYEFHPSNRPGPQMQPFDEAALENVRRLPKLYKEAE